LLAEFAGGVGLAAVELGKQLGLRVIALASSESKLAAARAKGADEIVPYANPDGSFRGFRETIKALTDGRGADIIYDPVGGDAFDESERCIAWGGRLLIVGFASGRISKIDANRPLIKGYAVIGVRAGEFGRREPEKAREDTAALHRLAEDGRLRPHIYARFKLSEANAAQALLADRKATGKVVLEMG
jgi:NADPH2:quinone reductase